METHLPETSCCPGCGGALREFGEDVSEVLEYIPESFKVMRHRFQSAAARDPSESQLGKEFIWKTPKA
ncbi:IS66 family transposase zinc-finger binding domain-containing protein [Granulicella aggregans]|uniref:IS66 family transposase zinc-finger binding domain-containing protein n=1 Tax=Granulicella aggregans TaxID=474949 RepID=UPI003D7C173B